MRIVFIGCVDFSYHCLKELLEGKEDVVAVFSKRTSPFNADYKDLQPLARRHHVPYHAVVNVNDGKWVKKIKSYRPDVIFCFGWSDLLKKEILQLAPLGVIGTHPAALPLNRGRHPLIWSLFLGLRESGLTFFRMNDKPDGGEIVSQKKFRIAPQDNAATVYKRIKGLATQQLKEFVPMLKTGKVKLHAQNGHVSNIWRKRSERDGLIDWRMSSEAIYNLVRALTHPYVGAHCVYRNKPVKVWQAKKTSCPLKNIEPGKILGRTGRRLTVKTYDGAVELIDHAFKSIPKKGEYLQW